jgi:hypothetical protein
MTRFTGRLAARLMLVLIVLQAAGAVHPALARVRDADAVAARQAPKPTLLAQGGTSTATRTDHAAAVAPKASASSSSPTTIMLLAGFGLMAFIARRRTRSPAEDDR